MMSACMTAGAMTASFPVRSSAERTCAAVSSMSRSGGVINDRGCSPVLRTERDGSTIGA